MFQRRMNRLLLSFLVLLAAAFPVIGLPGLGPVSALAAPGTGSDGTQDDVEDDIEDDIEDELEDDIEDDIEDDVEDEIESDIEDDVENDIEDDIEDDVEGDIEDDIEDDVEDDIEDDVEDDIEDDIEDDVEGDIEEDIEDDVEDGVESRIEDDVADRIDDRVEDNSGSGNSRDRDFDDDIESEIERDLDERSGSGGGDDIDDRIARDADDRRDRDNDDFFDAERDLARAEFDAAKDAADAARDAARAAARAERDAALALPGADEDAIRAQYDEAKDAADDGRDASREEAETTFKAKLSSIETAEEAQEDDDSGSSNSGPDGGNDDDDDDDNSGPGNNNDNEDDDDDEDDDNSGRGSGNSASGNANALSDAIFNLGYDDRGNEIEQGELLVLAPAAALDAIAEKGIATRELESLDGLDVVLASVDASDRGLKETEAAIREAAPDADIDYNHVYQRHDEKRAENDPREKNDENDLYRPEIKKSRGARFGEAPDKLFKLPVADGGAGRSIGLIDTKVDTNHATLANAKLRQQNFVPYAHEQPDVHGTSVASILAGEGDDYHGLLPKADVYAASVFFNSPTGSESATTRSLVSALYWMTENNVAVVNMSLTGPPNAILKSAIDRAYERGTVVVAAVGNGGPSSPPLYPAAYENVVAVTAVNKKNRVYRLANRGDHVDFAAPGVNVRHASEQDGFAASSGTSIAAPFVTAVLAASCNADGKLSTKQLSALADNAKDLGRKGFDPVYGNGLIRPLDN